MMHLLAREEVAPEASLHHEDGLEDVPGVPKTASVAEATAVGMALLIAVSRRGSFPVRVIGAAAVNGLEARAARL
jgi:hypothetical protein